jgi:2,3-bisphosphoglycerate-independent phosphoglycerate mutase
MAISETQKFGHVTYFFNGNRTGKFDDALEDYIEIPSDRVPFEERPWMKAAEIADKVVEAIHQGEHRFIRLNFANGDMVGHTGVLDAVRIAVETVDLCLARIVKGLQQSGGVLVASADHGNSDDMYERDKKTAEVVVDPASGKFKTKTSHSLNPVPVHIYDPGGKIPLRLNAQTDLGISSLAATCLTLLGFEPPADYSPSIVEIN